MYIVVIDDIVTLFVYPELFFPFAIAENWNL